VVLDKTGTVTEGKPAVTDLISFEGADPDRLLSLAASAENGSEHALGEAVVLKAREKGLALEGASGFRAIPGKGIATRVGAHEVLLGNRTLMEERGIRIPEGSAGFEELAAQGKTPMLVAVDGSAVGIVAVADRPKQTSAAAVSRLKEMGLGVVMITGDNGRTARAVAGEIGVDRVLAEVLPGEKAEAVKRLQAEGKPVAMVGDGINDAAALAQADVGIAIGAGTDIAIESADVILMRGDIGGVRKAIRLSKAAIRNVKQNLFWAFCYNALGIPIAAGLLHLFGGPLLSPMFAAAAMSLSSVSVVTNALRLKRFKEDA
jgi:Cu+-exporting ATPase